MIASNAFEDYCKLEKIEVSGCNQRFAIEDGVLFNKDKAIFIVCPLSMSRSYIVPIEVVEIGARAFFGCTLLEEVTFHSRSEKVDNLHLRVVLAWSRLKLREN